jgi:hypothetical protein
MMIGICKLDYMALYSCSRSNRDMSILPSHVYQPDTIKMHANLCPFIDDDDGMELHLLSDICVLLKVV